MRKISIFVAGEKDLETQCLRIKALANDLNEEYSRNRDAIIVNVCSYENFGEEQPVYNSFIKNGADLVIFVLEGRIGTKTEDEFLLAVEESRLSGTPEIMVFLRSFEVMTPAIGHIIELVNATREKCYVKYTSIEDLVDKAKEQIKKFIASRQKLIASRQMHCDVFISYSRKDSEVAKRICKAFDEAGITYFIDLQGISGGFEFPTVLAEAIINSRIFLYLASGNSYDSRFTQSEITFAFNEKPKGSILPYIIDGSDMPTPLRLVFSNINWRRIEEHPIDTVLVDDLLNMLGKQKDAKTLVTHIVGKSCVDKPKSIFVLIAGAKKLKQERLLLREQLSMLSNQYNLDIRTVTFEDFQTSLTGQGERWQEDYNRFIKEKADIVVFVFGSVVGGTTEKEFDVAYSSLLANDRPEIFVYVKKQNFISDKRLRSIKEGLFSDNQYYVEYNNVDNLRYLFYKDMSKFLQSKVAK